MSALTSDAPRTTGATPTSVRTGAGGGLGALPWIVLACAGGLACASAADALSRSGHGGGTPLFWLAIALIELPAALRLVSSAPRTGERLATVVVVGLSLYSIKVLRDPFAFTFGDEFAHLSNVQSILTSGHLFGVNSLLPVTPRYPGLEAVAAAIVNATGISTFVAGVIVVGIARAVEVTAIYLLYERISGSPVAAGLGALVYTATPTYLFFSAQFSYESLALPLASVALLALVRRGQSREASERRHWTAVFLAADAAVIATHHVTSYFLVAFVVGVGIIHLVQHGRRGAPWGLAVASAALTVAWLALVAGRTVGYLSPVITNALNEVVRTINREAAPRVLFASSGGVAQTPTGERAVAVVGVLLLCVGILAGLLAIWKRPRRGPALILLALLALAYIGTLPLRFVPAAWETASRASEFLFVGVGAAVALGVTFWIDRGARSARLRRLFAALAVLIVVASGIIAGWPASERLAEARVVAAGGRRLQPPSLVAAQWSGAALGRKERVFAQNADARYFVVDGRQVAFEGASPDVVDVLGGPTLQPWMRKLLRRYRITLVVTDRRMISQDNIVGFFFDVGAPARWPAGASNKFNLSNVDRLYDAGDIVIYGVRGLWQG